MIAEVFNDVLVSRDTKGKVRIILIRADYDNTDNIFTIYRETGIFNGKMLEQPDKAITKGKSKRSVEEQGELEYNSIIKKYLDKGYKNIKDFCDKSFEELDLSDIDAFLPMIKTDSNEVPKPMLAKRYQDVATSVFDKEYYASRKLDGVKCLIRREDQEDGTFILKSASRGGNDYDMAIRHILTDPQMIEIFTKYPDIILDGEIYKHGWTLQRISGTVRLEKITTDTIKRTQQLEFWIYDIADNKKRFDDRLDLLLEIKPLIDKSEVLQFVEHIPVSGWLRIKKLHDQFVKEGFEGCVIRRVDGKYEYGARKNTMIKIKDYSDREDLIVGWEPGLRPEEDMVFVMETKLGKRYKAKPMGSRSVKHEYVQNMDKIIGKMGTVTYFYLSEDGIPLQPTFKAIRSDGE